MDYTTIIITGQSVAAEAAALAVTSNPYSNGSEIWTATVVKVGKNVKLRNALKSLGITKDYSGWVIGNDCADNMYAKEAYSHTLANYLIDNGIPAYSIERML